MRYTGLVGEFKWWGFMIALTLCISFALFVFTRFDYVKVSDPDEAKVAAQASAAEAQTLRAEIKSLDRRLTVAECKIQLFQTRKQGSTKKNGTCSEEGN